MNNIGKDIAISVVSAGVIGLVGYFSIVKTNEVKIDLLTKEISNLRNEVKEAGTVINKTRLFVAQAHPSKALPTMSNELNNLENIKFKINYSPNNRWYIKPFVSDLDPNITTVRFVNSVSEPVKDTKKSKKSDSKEPK